MNIYTPTKFIPKYHALHDSVGQPLLTVVVGKLLNTVAFSLVRPRVRLISDAGLGPRAWLRFSPSGDEYRLIFQIAA